ncbi:alpha/beta hydrolase fold domain-containing protein [Hirsutella rhossiliensis]|uniref:Alpha/beta hydrolase fold domain-containing protein n=1 Tax=Hirsutella rhossiliensis TaxID=111463 RepID=A0A9P8MLQ8_9HYPO|nr:alpha/beta hydrolase fold domain-containing protein [Hirsutella rhossiliensis]KAH0957375.1 alpha/beta hydrolase fold domain-containing protein [Hirsutella rhossiliensis]
MVRLASLLGGLVSLAAIVTATPVPAELETLALEAPELEPAELEARAVATLGRSNDWSCTSTVHPNPVILLHGLFASEKLDLNFVEAWLRNKGFCTFALLYGSSTPKLPILGGIKPVAESSLEVAAFIREVHNRTGADKVDIVGHSEGGFQGLYVTKFHGVAPLVDQIIAIASPTHGTDVSGLYKIAYLFGKFSYDAIKNLLATVGCGACNDFAVDGAAVSRLNDGKPIVQPGNTVTIIASRYDEIVTPATTAFVQEPGVHNIFVQDYCPLDPVGHLGVSVDLNVWRLVLNSLERKIGRKFFCLLGPPGR